MSVVSDGIKAVADWPARYFLALGCVSAALLALSNSAWSEAFGLSDGPDWLRAALTAGIAIGFTFGILKTLPLIGAFFTAKKRRAAFEKELRSLTPDEAAVFATFFNQEAKTATFFPDGGGGLEATARALEIRGHVYKIQYGHDGWSQFVTYAIQERTHAFIKQNPEVLANARRRPELLPPGAEPPALTG